MAITGLAMGVIDTIANYQLVNLYQKDSAVFLQVRGVCVCVRESEQASIFWSSLCVFYMFIHSE